MKRGFCWPDCPGARGGYTAHRFPQVKPEILGQQRQAAMTLQGQVFFGRWPAWPGQDPYNADVVARNAAYLDVLNKMPWDGFAESTKDVTVKTAALPASGAKPAKFKEAQEKFQSAVSRLVAATKTGDEASIKAAILEVGKGGCGNCHQNFRPRRTERGFSDEARCGGACFPGSTICVQSKGRLDKVALTVFLCAALVNAFAQGDAKRGEYLAKAGGCVGCHTEEKKDGRSLRRRPRAQDAVRDVLRPEHHPAPAGGNRKLDEADFMRAMREGERPDGKNYFPAFPYTSFTKIVDGDLRDLWAFCVTLRPAPAQTGSTICAFLSAGASSSRSGSGFLHAGPFTNVPGLSDVANRGAYLVQALGHCSECHTPRNFFGGPK